MWISRDGEFNFCDVNTLIFISGKLYWCRNQRCTDTQEGRECCPPTPRCWPPGGKELGISNRGAHQDAGLQPHPGSVPGADVQSPPGAGHQPQERHQDAGLRPHLGGVPGAVVWSLPPGIQRPGAGSQHSLSAGVSGDAKTQHFCPAGGTNVRPSGIQVSVTLGSRPKKKYQPKIFPRV